MLLLLLNVDYTLRSAEWASIRGFTGRLWFLHGEGSTICRDFTVLTTYLSPNDLKLYAVCGSLSISCWDYNVSITSVVACDLSTLALSYGLFSHVCIPQAREMPSLFPKYGTHCGRETDRGTNEQKGLTWFWALHWACCPQESLITNWQQSHPLQQRYDRGRVSERGNTLFFVLSFSLNRQNSIIAHRGLKTIHMQASGWNLIKRRLS